MCLAFRLILQYQSQPITRNACTARPSVPGMGKGREYGARPVLGKRRTDWTLGSTDCIVHKPATSLETLIQTTPNKKATFESSLPSKKRNSPINHEYPEAQRLQISRRRKTSLSHLSMLKEEALGLSSSHLRHSLGPSRTWNMSLQAIQDSASQGLAARPSHPGNVACINPAVGLQLRIISVETSTERACGMTS